MRSIAATLLLLACTACGVAPQPENIRTVAAFEVPLPTPAEREAFLTLLRRESEVHGFHVDAATTEERKACPRFPDHDECSDMAGQER